MAKGLIKKPHNGAQDELNRGERNTKKKTKGGNSTQATNRKHYNKPATKQGTNKGKTTTLIKSSQHQNNKPIIHNTISSKEAISGIP
jgi:hypothetical protein